MSNMFRLRNALKDDNKKLVVSAVVILCLALFVLTDLKNKKEIKKLKAEIELFEKRNK